MMKADEFDKIDKIVEIISRPDTAIFYLPKGYEVVTVYSTDFRDEVEVHFEGDTSGSISEIVAIDGNERYRLTFNSTCPVPETIQDALINANGEGRTFIFAKEGDENERKLDV